MRRKNKVLIILFALVIFLPALDFIFNFSEVKEIFEKRKLATRPLFPSSFEEAKNYPKKFEEFFNDNYPMRNSFISMNSVMMDRIFDESQDARVLIGKDEWLYFDNYNSILDAEGKIKLDEKYILLGVEKFEQNRKNLLAKNIEYLLVIAPDKSSIYPEFLPDYVKFSYEKNHRIDQFLSVLLREYPDFPVLDLRKILLQAKEKEIIYHKTDTHWNMRGAYFGYELIMKFLNLNYNSRGEFKNKEDEFIRGDISDIMGVDLQNLNYDLMPKFKRNFYEVDASKAEKKAFHKPLIFANYNQNLPIIFVYKDSFFDNLAMFMSQNFSKSYYINEQPCAINLDVIKKYHPNIVIQEFWEGRTQEVLNKCS